MLKILIIGLGGFFGSISRYLTYQLFDKNMVAYFPYGTFTVNVIGSLILGVVYGLMQRDHVLSEEVRMFLAIGFCGSFTTFSTFAYENMNILKQGEISVFILYTSLSIFFSLLSVYGGYLLAK
ncbi:MAG: fluoride efflux transporter CrcB [Cyclobacteriaceae bacterium]|nr:fluoride efflux transporter CrcB [Cyclobacteriaceae bacterium]